MYSMRLNWKEFNVDLKAMETWFKAQSEDYKGNSADSALTLWFENEPSDEIKEAIQEKWDGLSEESEEAVSYKSRDAERAEDDAAKAAALATARSKLQALGLSDAEIDALKG